MAITKKMRFEVFKRDGFACAYCGKTPPAVTLEVDHIDPKSNGGKDDINNLITACFDCNRGKRDIPLDKAPGQLSDNLEVLKEKEEQLREYRKFINRIQRRIKRDMDDIEDLFSNQFPGYGFTDKFRDVSLKRFLDYLPKHEIIEAMNIATSYKGGDRDVCVKYFCGICWNKIRALESEA